MFKQLKIFFLIFFFTFLTLFLIFNGTAFISITAYKIKSFISFIKYEVTRPPLFLAITPTKNIGQKSMPFLMNFKEILKNTPSIKQSETLQKEYFLLALPKPLNSYKTNTLILLKFNIEAPIISVNSLNTKLIYQELKKGVVLFPGSDIPGEGYSIIIGHSSQYPWEPGRYKSVFSLLNQFQKDDLIYIVWEGKLLVFKVIEKKIFLPWPKGQESTETVFPPTGEKIVILQSCWPVGVAFKRVAVKAVLVNKI